jgi:neutral amino acid transport system ATP-binding protein
VHGGYVKGLNILQGVSLAVATGELVAIIGPNGAGKSTLAKAIAGLVRPHQGQIYFQGQSLIGLKPEQIVQRGLGYVPQLANIFVSLTVRENLEMGAFLHQGPLTPVLERVYGLFPRLAQRPHQVAGTLSGGERQMLAMAKALMLEPKLLVLDEPSAALSPILVHQVFAQIQQINQTGTAIILVEQNAHQALALADRGYVLEMGYDRITGTGSALLNDPRVGELYLGG